MEFTKGKWEIKKYSNVTNLWIKGDEPVCTINSSTDEETKANAQLIAHAPEMLEMLIKMREAILSEDFTRMLCESQSAKELITKATTI